MMMAEAAKKLEVAEAAAEGAGEAGKAAVEAARAELELTRTVATEAAMELEKESERRIKEAEVLLASGEGDPLAQLEAHKILEDASAQLKQSKAKTKQAAELMPLKVGKGDTEVRVRRSLFAQDAERKRKEKESSAEAQKRREAAMANAEEKRRAAKAAQRAEERKAAEAAIAKTEVAKKEREAALAAEAVRLAAEAEEMARLQVIRAINHNPR